MKLVVCNGPNSLFNVSLRHGFFILNLNTHFILRLVLYYIWFDNYVGNPTASKTFNSIHNSFTNRVYLIKPDINRFFTDLETSVNLVLSLGLI